jgi:hypothetical protein
MSAASTKLFRLYSSEKAKQSSRLVARAVQREASANSMQCHKNE